MNILYIKLYKTIIKMILTIQNKYKKKFFLIFIIIKIFNIKL